MTTLTLQQLNALNRYALKHGRTWRSKLQHAWRTDGGLRLEPEAALLQQLRNQGGPELIKTYEPKATDWTRLGFLKEDRQERYNLKRGWFVKAWRIVSEEIQDLVQPWSNSKSEAHATARNLSIYLVES